MRGGGHRAGRHQRAQRGPVGRLFRVAPDGTWREICDGLLTSNGLAWTHDGRTMLHTDSGAPWIDAWDFDPEAGTATNRRRIATPDADAIGRPDGAAFDTAGRYWSAGVRKGRINRFRTDGTLIKVARTGDTVSLSRGGPPTDYTVVGLDLGTNDFQGAYSGGSDGKNSPFAFDGTEGKLAFTAKLNDGSALVIVADIP